MLFEGKAISVTLGDEGIAHLVFDLQGESVNKLNRLTMGELDQALTVLKNSNEVKGLILSSAKSTFIVGADITEFGHVASQGEEAILAMVAQAHTMFSGYEDLPFPTVAAINGMALGGGLEMCLSVDYRVMADSAQIGFPEVKLGIIPGWGGTVRASRLCGADNAIEWTAGAKNYKAPQALAVGMVDAVVAVEHVDKAALNVLKLAMCGDFDYQKRRAEKTSPLQLDMIEGGMVFETSKGYVAQQAGKHYPAPVMAVKTIERHARLDRDEAMAVEAKNFAKLFATDVSHNLVNVFMGDQYVSKLAKKSAADAGDVAQAAVLGAGIMGGGIAYQSASTGTPIVMKDIAQAGIDMGLAEASKLLTGQVNRGRVTVEQMAATLSKINPTLSYAELENVDVVIEAVVENPKVKMAVLPEAEATLKEGAVLASNTSTIPISLLATSLKRPENFCGMHFFNPVHRMPLVEIIRGEKTSDATIAKVTKYALAMGKKPIVVNDCPGFLVNRVLFAYLAGFAALVNEGVDFRVIDKAAENFGWPMGPAYLCDVVGIDTCVHAGAVMAEGFPDRMSHGFKTAIEVLLENKRLGEKNSVGFYKYEKDKRGKNKKVVDETVFDLLKGHIASPKELSEEEIMNRLMVPYAMESVRCLEENIVASPTELDMAMVYGVGFPPFKGGIIRYLDSVGVAAFCEQAKTMSELGGLYQPTEKLLAMAANGESFYA
ncbi:fatty acid oxidation complex subunit alpha FadB [Dasania marina]|uniref:fatty acid oxidation complex subunit alpha FadB n=1 Tax=Dasania marina TaxID=471499 RepID=UPI0030D977CB|tara:strand:+ start:4804 stop:6951 length:2148 start_codon:yes stop_codon:yes gene_type:complete